MSLSSLKFRHKTKKAHEHAISLAMSIGKTLAWPWLHSAAKKRLKLIDEIVLTSAYATDLGIELDSKQKADLCIGLLTAATKNVAIGERPEVCSVPCVWIVLFVSFFYHFLSSFL